MAGTRKIHRRSAQPFHCHRARPALRRTPAFAQHAPVTLAELGWDDFFAAAFAPHAGLLEPAKCYAHVHTEAVLRDVAGADATRDFIGARMIGAVGPRDFVALAQPLDQLRRIGQIGSRLTSF